MFKMVIQDAVMVTSPNRTIVAFFGPCENKYKMSPFLRDSSGRVIKVYPSFTKLLDYTNIHIIADLCTHDLPDAESIIGLELFGVPREEWPER